jgi:hypothetical protein
MRLSAATFRVDWRIAIGQVVLIALGVLLGLAGNAWWGERQNRDRERSALRNALTAARVNERRLRQAVYEDSISLTLNERLATRLSDVPDDSLFTLASAAGWYSDGRPLVSPFAALLQTGDINHVQDTVLRRLLPVYVGEIEMRAREVNAMNDQWRQLMLNYPATLYRAPRPSAREVATKLGSDSGFHRLLFLRQRLALNAVANQRIMLRFTTELRQSLERVLAVAPEPLPQPRILRDSF